MIARWSTHLKARPLCFPQRGGFSAYIGGHGYDTCDDYDSGNDVNIDDNGNDGIWITTFRMILVGMMVLGCPSFLATHTQWCWWSLVILSSWSCASESKVWSKQIIMVIIVIVIMSTCFPKVKIPGCIDRLQSSRDGSGRQNSQPSVMIDGDGAVEEDETRNKRS